MGIKITHTDNRYIVVAVLGVLACCSGSVDSVSVVGDESGQVQLVPAFVMG